MTVHAAKLTDWDTRADLAAALRWAARLDMHEGVANHFLIAVNEAGTRLLINPNQRHFSRVRASDLVEIDADDPATVIGDFFDWAGDDWFAAHNAPFDASSGRR